MKLDRIVIGAGIYGLYSALELGQKGYSVAVLEKEAEAFTRATYINQARVHMGYHYPRSYSTAKKSANYFNKFVNDYPDCIYNDFDQIYATSSNFSWTNAEQFERFCRHTGIVCERVNVDKYFKYNQCDGAFLTREYTYDAKILMDYFLKEIEKLPNVQIYYSVDINSIVIDGKDYLVCTNLDEFRSSYVINATYAGVNTILSMLGFEQFKIKYELCEIILCKVNDDLKNTGLTVMDGPFFSIMPFGKTGYHSLTSVTFTPHAVCYESLPKFECQKGIENYCSPRKLGNCNNCPHKPESAWPYMSNLARKYMKDNFQFEYVGSLYSMKPILMASEIDDSRPTVIRKYSENPYFYSVLSGKINTVYDLEGIL